MLCTKLCNNLSVIVPVSPYKLPHFHVAQVNMHMSAADFHDPVSDSALRSVWIEHDNSVFDNGFCMS